MLQQKNQASESTSRHISCDIMYHIVNAQIKHNIFYFVLYQCNFFLFHGLFYVCIYCRQESWYIKKENSSLSFHCYLLFARMFYKLLFLLLVLLFWCTNVCTMPQHVCGKWAATERKKRQITKKFTCRIFVDAFTTIISDYSVREWMFII